MPENIKLVIGAKNFSVQSEAGFFNRIGQQQTFNTNKNGDPEAAVNDSLTLWSISVLAACNTQEKQTQRKQGKRGGFRDTGCVWWLLGIGTG